MNDILLYYIVIFSNVPFFIVTKEKSIFFLCFLNANYFFSQYIQFKKILLLVIPYGIIVEHHINLYADIELFKLDSFLVI